MSETITMPRVDGVPDLVPRQWEVIEDPEAGLGLAIDQRAEPHIRNGDPCVCFECWHVQESDPVGPGQTVAEVLVNGMIFPVLSFSHGIVSGLVEMGYGYMIDVGNIIANIASRPDHSSRKTGLIPKPSTFMRALKMGFAFR